MNEVTNPHEISQNQKNAIALLVAGKADSYVAAEVGVSR